MKKLHPHFKAKWLEALRSGEYAQTTEHLHTEDGFCCLGVACHLYDPNQWYPVELDTADYGVITVYESTSRNDDLPARGDLPDEIFDTLLQRHSDASGQSILEFIAVRNDEGWSFAKIADWIEEHL